MRIIVTIIILIQSQFSFGVIIKGQLQNDKNSFGKITRLSEFISGENETIQEFKIDSTGSFALKFNISPDKIYWITILSKKSRGSFYIENKGEYTISSDGNYINVDSEKKTNFNSEFKVLMDKVSKLFRKNQSKSFKKTFRYVERLDEIKANYANKQDQKSLIFKYYIIFSQLSPIRNFEEFESTIIFKEIEKTLLTDEFQPHIYFYTESIMYFYAYVNFDNSKLIRMRQVNFKNESLNSLIACKKFYNPSESYTLIALKYFYRNKLYKDLEIFNEEVLKKIEEFNDENLKNIGFKLIDNN